MAEPALIPQSRILTAEAFQGLADIPPELEWFANIENPRTYQHLNDKDFP